MGAKPIPKPTRWRRPIGCAGYFPEPAPDPWWRRLVRLFAAKPDPVAAEPFGGCQVPRKPPPPSAKPAAFARDFELADELVGYTSTSDDRCDALSSEQWTKLLDEVDANPPRPVPSHGTKPTHE